MPQAEEQNGRHVFQTEDAAEQGHTHHAEFESGHVEFRKWVGEYAYPLRQCAGCEEQQAEDEDGKVHQDVGCGDFHTRKGNEKYRREPDVDNELLDTGDAGIVEYREVPENGSEADDEQKRDKSRKQFYHIGSIVHRQLRWHEENMMYVADEQRYDKDIYTKCGNSGLRLPRLSLGLWHNFGDESTLKNARDMIFTAFDLGVTHFDLANNYGPPPGSAEENFGKILHGDLSAYRDELIISSKAGYLMWPGPYGEWGSRKYLLSSLDQSLKRMKLDYVDIFYSHRYDPNTPLEETMGALATAVKQGKALYAGISSYSATKTREAYAILKDMGVPILIHQPSYSMLNRWVEEELLDALRDLGIGCIAFSPLAQGMLTSRYLKGVPADSRAARGGSFNKDSFLTEENLGHIRALSDIADGRGQKLAQMALSWVLRDPVVTSVLIGASRPEQIRENVSALDNLSFTADELAAIDTHALDAGINLWAQSSNAG
jgi:L-glyceraldehyde 3-phosphate reductase